MIKSLVVLVFMLFAFYAQAATPFHPYEEAKFKEIEAKNSIQSQKFTVAPTLLKYATGSTVILGSLPANAVIVRDFIYVETALAGSTATLLSLGCVTAVDLAATSTMINNGNNGAFWGSGTMLNGAYNFPNTATKTLVTTGTTGCNVKATVGSTGTGITAGEMELNVEYILY